MDTPVVKTPMSEADAKAAAVEKFRQQILEREAKTGEVFTSATGLVEVNGETWRVTVPIRAPEAADTTRSQDRDDRKALGFTSGRQWKRFRKERQRRLRRYLDSPARETLVEVERAVES